MAYFSKEAYERKAEHAYRVSADSLDILSESTGIDREDLAIIEEASHIRHEIHSVNRRSLISWDGCGFDNIKRVGIDAAWALNDGCIADRVNELNLIEDRFPLVGDVMVNDEDSTEDIFDYFGEEMPEGMDEYDLRQYALELLFSGWDEVINEWSSAVRAWFRKLNEKYGTSFPD